MTLTKPSSGKAMVCSEKPVCWAFTAKTRSQLRTLIFFKSSANRLNQQPARPRAILANSGLATLGSPACTGRSLFLFGVKCCKHVRVKWSPAANLCARRSTWSSDACTPHGDKPRVGAPDLTSHMDVDAPPDIAQNTLACTSWARFHATDEALERCILSTINLSQPVS